MRYRCRRSGSAGFSLIEMLIVVVMIGLMSLFGWPKVVRIFDQSQVRSARQAVMNKFNTAKINARQHSRHTFLVRSGDFIWIERSPPMVVNGASTRDTIPGSYHDLFHTWKVEAAGDTEIPIDPRGLTVGTGPWRIVLSRGSATDSVIISGFGVVTR